MTRSVSTQTEPTSTRVGKEKIRSNANDQNAKAIIAARIYIKQGETKSATTKTDTLCGEQILWSNRSLIPNTICRPHSETVKIPVTNTMEVPKVFRIRESVGTWEQGPIVEKTAAECVSMMKRTTTPFTDRWNILIEMLNKNKFQTKFDDEFERVLFNYQDLFEVNEQ